MYTNEKNALILLSLLKAHGIRKIVVSPGANNIPISASIQNDDFFEVYSSIDERSAAYMACGIAESSGEMVALSCTGATASRNYMPALTEAFYRKLPIIALTSFNGHEKIGHLVPQNIDRTVEPNDTVKYSVQLPDVKDVNDEWTCNIRINQAIIEAQRDGGGPVLINISCSYSGVLNIKSLPAQRVISRITVETEKLPSLENKKIAIFIGSRKPFSTKEIYEIELFCKNRNAIVIGDHTSAYKGNYKIQGALVNTNINQFDQDWKKLKPDVVFHLGEISGDYPTSRILSEAGEVWRISPDGQLRDTGKKLKYIYDGSVLSFFRKVNSENVADVTEDNHFHKMWLEKDQELRCKIPELPFSNLWLASRLSGLLPDNSKLFLAILNSLRSWNFFNVSNNIEISSNVGGFGIDGCLSTALGSSVINCDKIHFVVLGDLAFFYDINSLGNRSLNKNLRILLINNGTGVEFNNSSHVATKVGVDPNKFIAAGGHYNSGILGKHEIINAKHRAKKSLAKAWCEQLGFKYSAVLSKTDFEKQIELFTSPEISDNIILECFTNIEDESNALELMSNLNNSTFNSAVKIAKSVLPRSTVNKVKSILKK